MRAQNLDSILQLMLVGDLNYPVAGIGMDKDNLLLTRLVRKVVRTLHVVHQHIPLDMIKLQVAFAAPGWMMLLLDNGSQSKLADAKQVVFVFVCDFDMEIFISNQSLISKQVFLTPFVLHKRIFWPDRKSRVRLPCLNDEINC